MEIQAGLVIDMLDKLHALITRTHKNKSKRTMVSYQELWGIKEPILTAISELK